MRNKRGKRVSTKPWQTAAWRKRRAALIEERGARCQICGTSSEERTLAVHHTVTLPGEEGFARYMELRDADVQIVCKGCHTMISRGYVRCATCNLGWQNPRYPCCLTCSPRGDEIRAQAADDRRWNEIESLLAAGCECEPECAIVTYTMIDAAGEDDGGGAAHRCIVERLRLVWDGRMEIHGG